MKKKHLILLGILTILVITLFVLYNIFNNKSTIILDNGFILKNIEITDKEQNIVKFDIENTNNEDMKNLQFTIMGFDDNNNIIFTHNLKVDELKTNETYRFNDKIIGDLSNVTSYKIAQSHFMTTG